MTMSPRESAGRPEAEASRRTRRAAPVNGKRPGRAAAFGALGLALAATAAVNYALARRAERRHPPDGRFITVDGVRLHYLERGSGPAIVLLHGNGASAGDFVVSGVFGALAADHRVIAFDRPGFGFSERPRNRVWTAAAQADLLHAALGRLGVGRAVLVGHSWGTLVALAMALRDPAGIAGLVLLSGYYYPSPRADVVLLSGPAVPLLGDVLRYTASPILGRLLAPAIYRRLFAPAPVTRRFAERFPLELSLRPWQIRASAAESALMIPAAAGLASRYPGLSVPAAIVAGTGDRIVDFDRQPARLGRDLPGSTLRAISGAGHMIHHTDPDEVTSVIRDMIRRADAPRPAGSPSPGP